MYKNQKGTSLSKFNEVPFYYTFGISFFIYGFINFTNGTPNIVTTTNSPSATWKIVSINGKA